METLQIESKAGSLKIAGVLLSVGGTMLISLYKGSVVHLWNSIRQHHKESRVEVASNQLRGTIFLAGSSLTFASWCHTQNVAERTGLPSTVVPPPPLPPPPPTYEVSTSPNLSLEPYTSGSAIEVENPDDTLNRIARGIFGGYVNTSVSADGNYSSSLDDDLALF